MRQHRIANTNRSNACAHGCVRSRNFSPPTTRTVAPRARFAKAT
jgi:hypothetical protein